jgi:hypothetical protein
MNRAVVANDELEDFLEDLADFYGVRRTTVTRKNDDSGWIVEW